MAYSGARPIYSPDDMSTSSAICPLDLFMSFGIAAWLASLHYKSKKSMYKGNFLWLWIVMILSSVDVIGQGKVTLSGTIKDGQSGETLIGAVIQLADNPQVGAVSNEYGFYSISLDQGSYKMRVSYIGYDDLNKVIDLSQNTTLDWEMGAGVALQEVVIEAVRQDDNLTQAKMGTEVLNIQQIAKIPVVFGEKDIIKTIQLLPGVKTQSEGSNGFSVRGGSTDQNLIILDEAPVYNASHLLGFFSTFNSDAIKDATIIKGNSPAQYGGRLSSVLDVKMKEGNNKDYQVSGGLGIISSRLTVEGPLQKEKSSFIVSGRRTYLDLFLKATEDFKDTKLYFYDLNAKANYKIDEKNKIYFSGYFGQDKLGFGNTFSNEWGNTTGTLRWNRIVNPKLFSNTSLIYSNYDFNVGITSGETDFNINSNIKDWNLKEDFTYYANPKNAIRFGANVIHHTITPTRFTGTVISTKDKVARQGLESAIYATNLYTASSKLSMEYGLRLSAYTLIGGDTYNIYNQGVRTESIVLESGKLGKTYFNLEPRFTINYQLSKQSSIKGALTRNTQHLHLMSNSNSGSPTDQWLANSYSTKPEIADQISLGYSRNLKDNAYEINTEVYYKSMQNQVDYKDGADVNAAIDIESELLYGSGRAYGMEVLFKKKQGALTGWLSYTLSKTERKIDGINNGAWYNSKFDRTHDISVVGIYQLSKAWSLSGTFIYNTGNAVTLPTGKYEVNGSTVYQYAERNASRMPATHRLDIGATYERQRKGRYQSSWNFSLYNAYGRQNPFTITFRESETNPGTTEAVQTSLFRWVPSVTYNFKF
jgi:hypothetical protein